MAVDEKEILREIEGLPKQAIYEVIDFIRFLRFKTIEPEQGWFWTEGKTPRGKGSKGEECNEP